MPRAVSRAVSGWAGRRPPWPRPAPPRGASRPPRRRAPSAGSAWSATTARRSARRRPRGRPALRPGAPGWPRWPGPRPAGPPPAPSGRRRGGRRRRCGRRRAAREPAGRCPRDCRRRGRWCRTRQTGFLFGKAGFFLIAARKGIPFILRRMAFPPVESSVDFVALEERVLERWRSHDVFAESLRRREGSPDWVFYEGPPTANGRPGLHHVWARSFKDLFPRFHTMRGRYVARKGGWDCHGLPVEVEVEKALGITNKHEIEDFGIEAFNQRCRESVQRYVEDWSALTARIGMWIDTADAYWTLDNEYIESVWWLIRQMWDRDLVYEGFKVVPYCGRCGTALSSHELGQPGAYQDVREPSVYVRFPVVGADFDLLVWTTTPWTLVSNVAAAVGPEIEFVRVKAPDGGC